MGDESWKSGLSGYQLTKVTDLEGQLTRTKKERAEKLMQLEILQQTLEKQKRKVCFNTVTIRIPDVRIPENQLSGLDQILDGFIYLFIQRESKGTLKSDGERGTKSSKCEWLYVLHNFMTEHK